jgi:hypothetical protein
MSLHEYRVGGVTHDQRRLLTIADAVEGRRLTGECQLELRLISAYLRGKALGLKVPDSLEALALSQLTYLNVGKEVYQIIKSMER